MPDTAMKTPPTFEIRVAFVGYVSVGKTTVINALFGAKYSEVSMRRTTAVVNSFRISTPAQEKLKTNDESKKAPDAVEWAMVVDKPYSPAAALEQSVADNALHRSNDVVQEKTFDIILDDPPHEMREDTKLVIVDIPGINEAGSSSKYKDYVNENWHSFDVVVVVMDARQGVNTEEQMNLLELVEKNQVDRKFVPLIVLCNKVDDPDDEEQCVLLDEAHQETERRFSDSKLSSQDSRKTAFVPMSARQAFIYRCGSRLSFEEFGCMEQGFIDKIGKDCYGNQWRRWDKKRKFRMAFDAVSDLEQNRDGVETSN